MSRRPILTTLALATLGFVVPVLRFDETIARDWDYFNGLSLLVRSSVWTYGTFPLHDPWMCGGLDLLTNAQTRILSPFLLFDVLFPPLWANWLSPRGARLARRDGRHAHRRAGRLLRDGRAALLRGVLLADSTRASPRSSMSTAATSACRR